MFPCVAWLLLLFVQVNHATSYRITDEEYEMMPPIVTLDPFEKCLRRPGGQYCTAYATFVDDKFNPLLHQIQEFSRHTPSHFNHTRALFGTCLTDKKCENFNNNTTTDTGRVLEACLNHSVLEKYQLKVKVDEDVSCYEHNQKRMNIGIEDLAVACVLLLLVLCNAVGSCIDISGTKQDNGIVVRFLLCFSIPRNCKRLIAPLDETDSKQQKLKAMNGARGIAILAVILGHGMLPLIIISSNPKFVEDQYEILPIHILLNGSVLMQMFLFLSAFFLVYTCLVYAEDHLISWTMLPKVILWRFLRLTPSYAIVLMITATWIRYVSTGPVWDLVVVKESLDCRRYWWQHLLFINNYEDRSMCMPQTWYLATDTQLYCLGLTIFVFFRSSVARNLVLLTLFLAGLVIPALHTYYQDLDGSLLITPTAAVGFFICDRTFNEVYKRSHTNISCYIMGMAFGYFIYSLHKNNFDASKYWRWRPVYWSLLPLTMLITISCKVFYEDGPRVHLFYRVLVSAFMKPSFGLAMGLIVVGATLKMDSLYRGILEWSGWTVPARLSYSAYLVHVAVIRVMAGMYNQPVYSSYTRLTEILVTATVLTFAAAFIFYVTVEAPLARVVKPFRESSPGQNTKEDIKPEKTEITHTKK